MNEDFKEKEPGFLAKDEDSETAETNNPLVEENAESEKYPLSASTEETTESNESDKSEETEESEKTEEVPEQDNDEPQKAQTKDKKTLAQRIDKLSSSVLGLGVILFTITAVAALLLSVVNSITAPEIERRRADAAAQSMKKVIEADDYELIPDTKIYRAKVGGEVIGFVTEQAPKGYGGAISLMVGVNLSGQISGVDIVKHSETPGFGAKAKEEAWFTEQFKGKGVSLQLGVDVDAISGSTITSTAVTKGVQDAVSEIMQYLLGG